MLLSSNELIIYYHGLRFASLEKHPSSWEVEDVGRWLHAKGFGQYEPVFSAHSVNGYLPTFIYLFVICIYMYYIYFIDLMLLYLLLLLFKNVIHLI